MFWKSAISTKEENHATHCNIYVPGRSREEKAALAEKVRALVSEELKKDPKVVTVSVHDVPAEKWQEHLDAIPGEERFY
ncbi:4-oxalocrotonate tautomerase family enzyme [Clostridium sp. AF50-3]|nr:4-oxalocrotonate tautomerase family enzyme [Clostridium sp. AF50-3]RHQ21431.1 4-oxalocrotonate tautomerase family enzyme [Clostridium sp. AM48-13]